MSRRFSLLRANSLHNLLVTSGFEERHVNRYIDTIYLAAIYQKTRKPDNVELRKDDCEPVLDFSVRWHKETIDHYATS